MWEDLCSECGVSIQRALVGKGNIRYRYYYLRNSNKKMDRYVAYFFFLRSDSECKHVLFCEFCYAIGIRLLQLHSDDVITRHQRESNEDLLLPSVSPHLAEKHYVSEERNHPVISRLEIFETDENSSNRNSNEGRLCEILRKVFGNDAYRNRRCVGKRRGGGGGSSRGIERARGEFEWKTYEQVFRRAENLATGEGTEKMKKIVKQKKKEEEDEEERKKERESLIFSKTNSTETFSFFCSSKSQTSFLFSFFLSFLSRNEISWKFTSRRLYWSLCAK